MSSAESNEILPGLSIDATGEVTVDKRMGELLFDLALQLEDAVSDPVDIEHVLAAMVLASRADEIDSTTPLTKDNTQLLETLRGHIKTVFDKYDGQLGHDQP